MRKKEPKEETKNKKVLVAMSGGVDSSVAVHLLKEKGYEVTGAFLRMSPDYSESEKKAKLSAKKLSVDLKILDVRKEFKKEIINSFKRDYEKGLTPNPCVWCNKEIKFDLLLKKVKTDYIATGHYVSLKNNKLFKAKDKEKDQSYFLWKLNKKILEKTLFPNGDYKKSEIRKIAQKLNLSINDSEESQDICFQVKFAKKPGNIIDTKKKVVGKHNGLCFYTIGQRKGIGLAGGPYYVLAKDVKNNILIVTRDEKDLFSKEVNFKNANWISRPSKKIQAKIRYKHQSALGILKGNKFIFSKPQKAITSGQSVVFYNNNELLGGGIII